MCLSGYVFCYGIGFWIDWDLIGSDYYVIQVNVLYVWVDCCWCIFCCNSFVYDFF